MRRRRYRRSWSGGGRRARIHPLIWIVIGALLASAYFIVIEKSPPQKLTALVSDSWGEVSSTPTPVSKDAVLGRADVLNELYWATLQASWNCTAAVGILSDFAREVGDKYGFSTNRDTSGNVRTAIQGFLDRGGSPQEAWERLDLIDDLTKRIERACL